MTLQSRQDLMKVFKDIARQFEQVKHTVSDLEDALFAPLDDLKRKVDDRPAQLARNAALNEAMKPLYQAIRDEVSDWIEGVRAYERNTEFRRHFGDSLLIFAYGKVKAGKSSLGNYLAYGHSRPDGTIIDRADPKPVFFKHDTSGASDEDAAASGRFRVDTLEATASIQGFQLPGLTWVDVPGLDSLTRENGRLAQQYVEAADLVLFLTRSSSPMRASELQHILELLQDRKKPLAVVITACDTVEEDEVDDEIVNRLVMKSETDLQAQKNWVRKELEKLPADARRHLLHCGMHPISVRYAEEHPDEAGWRDSGLADFAGQIAAIATDDGLRLKTQTPLRNLKAFAEKLRRSSQKLNKHLSEMENNIRADQEALRRLARQAQTRIQTELERRLHAWIERHAMDDAAFRQAVEKGVSQVVRRHLAPLEKEIQKQTERFAQRAQTPSSVPLDLPGFQRRTRRIPRRTTSGKRIGSGVGASVGALIGGALVGPVGMAVGTAVGLYLGGKAGEQFDSEETLVVDLGDNRLEVRRQTRWRILEFVEGEVGRRIDEMEQVRHRDLQNWIAGLRVALNRLDDNIDKVQNELEVQP